MVAGGLSTRLGSDLLRGDLPIGPVTERSIFRLQGEKIAAIKDRFSPKMPWLVMTSSNVHEQLYGRFSVKFFGVSPDDVWFFQQTTMPVLDGHRNPIPLENGSYLESPVGHGGMLNALEQSGLLSRLRELSIDYLFHFQYPNVLERVCDPVMLGYHHMGGFEASTKAIIGYEPHEELGRCVEQNGLLRIVEYHSLKDKKLEDWWHEVQLTLAHMLEPFFHRALYKSRGKLPYHVIPHNSPVNAPKPLQKVEQFVFDLLTHTNKAGLVVGNRDKEYAPVKRMHGLYSLESGRKALSALYRSWLNQSGAVPATSHFMDYQLEISPLFALCEKDLVEKLTPHFRYNDGLTLY